MSVKSRFERSPCFLLTCACGGDAGFGHAEFCLGGVEVCRSDQFTCGKLTDALHLLPLEGRIGLRLPILRRRRSAARFVLLHGGFVDRGVNLREQLAYFDFGVVVREELHDPSRDLSADVDADQRRERSRCGDRRAELADLCRDGVEGERFYLRLLVEAVAVPRGCEQQGDQHNSECGFGGFHGTET